MTGQLKNTLSHWQSSKAVFTDAERLKNTLQADSDRVPKGSRFMLHLHMFCRRTNKFQPMACEIRNAGEHCCKTCGGVCARSPWTLISPSAFWIPIWAPLRTSEAVARVAVFRIGIFCQMSAAQWLLGPLPRQWELRHPPPTQVQHMGAGASWAKGLTSPVAQPVNFGISDCVLRW